MYKNQSMVLFVDFQTCYKNISIKKGYPPTRVQNQTVRKELKSILFRDSVVLFALAGNKLSLSVAILPCRCLASSLRVIKTSSGGTCLRWGSIRLAGSKLCRKDIKQRNRNNKQNSQLVIASDLWHLETMRGRGSLLLLKNSRWVPRKQAS